jgi:hypothetical protein
MSSQSFQQKNRETFSTLASFKDIHQGETIIVCGCGESLNQFEYPEQFVTIGVNDIGRRFHPDYLVVVNPRNQFSGDRLHYLVSSQARYLFSQYDDLQIPYPQLIKFQLGTRGGTDFNNPNVLHYTQNSPYIALCLAIHMGAKRIGLIGVDFTDNHFFGKTGTHPLVARLGQINQEYAALLQTCRNKDIEVVNLSPISRLIALPKVDFSWATARASRVFSMAGKSKGLKVISYATTPVAGVPAILARCISSVTEDSARCVWATDSYGNGVEFLGDVQWKQQPNEALRLLEAADVVIVHNGKVDPVHRQLLDNKPVITMAHNYAWNVDMSFVTQGQPGVVVGQYQATLPEFAGWSVVPNPVPLWESEYQSGVKNDQITIAFTPSGRHETYPQDHRLYWHSKGFDSTMRILERLSKQTGIKIESTFQGQVNHARSLEMKRHAHIVIDECVTGSYHRNSLEGLATGCVVVNGLGIIKDMREVLIKCAGDYPDWLFVPAKLDNLEAKLNELLALGVDELLKQGLRRRIWMESHWNFKRQWETHWLPVIEQAISSNNLKQGKSSHKVFHKSLQLTAEHIISQTNDSGLTVIVPFGGKNRLGLLEATIAGLCNSSAVDQIVIVEFGSEPLALEIAQRWLTDFLFIFSEGAFDKARCLNAGSALARNSEILWCDGDLLVEKDFFTRALQEFREKQFDFFYPFSKIEYLNEADSEGVRAGTRKPSDCQPIRIHEPIKHVPGGMGLIRAELLRNFGGMIEGFLGWGGEDNAWAHKARLVGRVGATKHPDQVAWHLFHQDSGATSGQPLISNPHYEHNVKLLDEIIKIKTVHELQHRFPPPTHELTPWLKTAKLYFLVSNTDKFSSTRILAQTWSQCFSDIYGLSIPIIDAFPNDSDQIPNEDNCAIVVFVTNEISCLSHIRAYKNKAVILVLEDFELNEDCLTQLVDVPFVMARTREQIETLSVRGIRVWHTAWEMPKSKNAMTIPLLTQPLSVLFGTWEKFGADTRQMDVQQKNFPDVPRIVQPIRLSGMSVIIPHSGDRRLPLLAASLANIAQLDGVDEFIVVELGTHEYARELTARWGGRYVFVKHQGPFERARALNIGTAIAFYELVMWMDGDLLLPPNFVVAAKEEMTRLLLDFFLPHWRMYYLSEIDSHEVRRGTRNPGDCKPIEVWRGGISVGAIGIVRANFVDQYGGLVETFRGWGYEDNAWWHKARLLGKAGITQNSQQSIYHLYHPKTEVDPALLVTNKALFQGMEAISTAKEFFTRYPPPSLSSCPWSVDVQLLFITTTEYLTTASSVAKIFRETYGNTTEIICFDLLMTNPESLEAVYSSDALVLFGENLASIFFAEKNCKEIIEKSLIVIYPSNEKISNKVELDQVSRCYLKVEFNVNPRFALSLVEPLSLILGKAKKSDVKPVTTLPVWTYWEGPCPDWIEACLRTFRKHIPEIRILDPESFENLRHNDQDINLKPLLVAQRADFIRAYLLTHFGGLWIDADCLLMRRPTQIFERLREVDFVVHQERQGWFSNAFMAARLGSHIARVFYERICFQLRSGASLGWTSLGAVPLTEILRRTEIPAWDELECERVQPVCWSTPEVFFNRNTLTEHEAYFRHEAICYMLSNTEINKYLSIHPEKNLLEEGTFFRFLLGRALTESPITELATTHLLSELPFMIKCLEAVNPSHILQIGSDNALWGMLAREWWSERTLGNFANVETPSLVAVRLPYGEDALYGLDVFDKIYSSYDTLPTRQWCLAIITTATLCQPPAQLIPLLRQALDVSNYLFIPTISDVCRDNAELLGARIILESDETGATSGLLLSRNDPICLRRPSNIQQVFDHLFQENRARGQESLSGTGSTLAQTIEIRQRLPLLLQHIGARSLLDAACGDFNWMKQVFLGIDSYTGVDILEELIVRNRENYGNPSRNFEVRDITRDFLPQTDVILCRDCLGHFNFEVIRRTLLNFRRSGARYLLTTTFPQVRTNSDIEIGSWQPINLEREPFLFPKPLALINEKCTEAGGRYADKSLGLWLLSEIGL